MRFFFNLDSSFSINSPLLLKLSLPKVFSKTKQNQAFLRQGIEYYQRSAIGNTLMAKIISDMIDFSKQDLKFVEYIEPSNMFYIYVFEKE